MSLLATATRKTSDPEPLITVARRNRWRRAVPTAVVAVLLFIVAFLGFAASEPKPTGHPVLAVAVDVAAGHQLAAPDLRVVTVSAPGIATAPVGAEAQYVGRSVTADLRAGSLLSPLDVSSGDGPPPGEAVVGVAVKGGNFPAGLQAGATVAVLTSTGTPIATATVYGVQPSGDGSGADVSLLLGERLAVPVATAAGSGSVSLVWVTP